MGTVTVAVTETETAPGIAVVPFPISRMLSGPEVKFLWPKDISLLVRSTTVYTARKKLLPKMGASPALGTIVKEHVSPDASSSVRSLNGIFI